MDNVCNRRLFSIPSKVEMVKEQKRGYDELRGLTQNQGSFPHALSLKRSQ